MTINYQSPQSIFAQVMGIYSLVVSTINLFNLLVFNFVGGVFLMVKTLCALSSKAHPSQKIDLVVYYNWLPLDRIDEINRSKL
jgi:hypothetical protein